MQVIKYSKECKWLTECQQCGCVFVYTGADIGRETVWQHYGMKDGEAPPEDKAGDEHKICVVYCPECKYKVRVPKMAMNRQRIAVEDDFDDDWD